MYLHMPSTWNFNIYNFIICWVNFSQQLQLFLLWTTFIEYLSGINILIVLKLTDLSAQTSGPNMKFPICNWKNRYKGA